MRTVFTHEPLVDPRSSAHRSPSSRTATRGPAHGDLVTYVVDPAGLVVGPDDVELERPTALPVDHRVDIFAASALPFQRPHFYPDSTDNPHEEQPEQEDDAELQHPQYGGVVNRNWSGNSCRNER